jgi:hypothetical protein
MGKENHQLLRYGESPRSGFVQLVVYPDSDLFHQRENFLHYPPLMRIVSNLFFPAKAARVAVYLRRQSVKRNTK